MLKIIKADIVYLWHRGYTVCVTTNGFVKKDGSAVMGRGNAKAMAEAVPELPVRLGSHIKKNGNNVGFIYDRIIAFPVKPVTGKYEQVLDKVKHLYAPGQVIPGFHCKADLEIIRRSALQLIALVRQNMLKVFLPLPGVGNGELRIDDIKEVLELLVNNGVILVRK